MEISKIILGTAQFGWAADEKTSFEVMDRYMSLGGKTFDTARVYGNAERVLGEFVRAGGIRKDVVIVTKGAHYVLDDPDRTPRLSESDIKLDISHSLDALKTDYVDIFLLHRDDPTKDVGEIVEAMHGIVRSGLAKYIGVSNWKYDRIKEANEYAKKHSLTPLKYNQVEFGRAVINSDYRPDPTIERLSADEYEKAACEPSVKIMAYSSQCNGFFYQAEKYGIENLPATLKAKFLNAYTLQNLRLITSAAKDLGVTPAAMALSSVINDKLNIAAVVGASSVLHVDEIMSSLELDPTVVRALSEKLGK